MKFHFLGKNKTPDKTISEIQSEEEIPTRAISSQGGLYLEKNDELDLTKANPSLSRCAFGAYWETAAGVVDFDLDVHAFLLGENNKINNRATDIVYYRQERQQGIYLDGDNRTGSLSSGIPGDCERIIINLNEINRSIHRIILIVSIYDAVEREQTFGLMKNSYVRLVDIGQKKEKEICRFMLSSDYAMDTIMTAAELYRQDGKWFFKLIGEGLVGDLNRLYIRYR